MITFLSLLVALCTSVAWRCQVSARQCQLSSWSVTNLCSFWTLGSHQWVDYCSVALHHSLLCRTSVCLKAPTTTGFLTFCSNYAFLKKFALSFLQQEDSQLGCVLERVQLSRESRVSGWFHWPAKEQIHHSCFKEAQTRFFELFWLSTKLQLHWRKPENNTLQR